MIDTSIDTGTGCPTETLSEAMQAWFAVVNCAAVTRYQHGENARELRRYFGKRPISDFAGVEGGLLVMKYAQDETGAQDRGLRETFSGPGNLVAKLAYTTLRRRLCTLRHVLEHALERGTLATMPTPWPIPRPGSHGHVAAGRYLLASERESAIQRDPAPVHRAPVYARQSEVPIGVLSPGGVTLGQALDRFLRVGMRRATPATREARTDHVRWLIHFFGADRPLSEFSETSGYRLLSEFVEKEGPDLGGRGIKFVTIRKRLDTLRMALTEAVRRGDLGALPFFPELPRDSKPRERYLTPGEYRSIRALLLPPGPLFLDVGVWTGQHTSDIVTMSWAMVDLGNGPGNGPGPGPAFWLRRNTKNKKQPVWLPLPDELRASLTAAYEENPPTRPDGLIVGPWSNARARLRRACHKLGISRVAPIDLRRTCATWWIEKGGPKDALRQWLGHSVTSAMVEKHYAMITPAMAFQGVDALNRAARDPGSPAVVIGPRLLGPAPMVPQGPRDEGRA